MPTFLSDYEGVNSSVNARSGKGDGGGSIRGELNKHRTGYIENVKTNLIKMDLVLLGVLRKKK